MTSAPPADAGFLHDIYVDESSQTKHRFLCLGGLLLRGTHAGAFNAAVEEARLPELPHGELAWTKVSAAKLPAYRRVVDAAFALMHGPPCHEFHMLVVDTWKLKHALYNDGDREVGFSKEVYQLCQKFGRLHRTARFHVYLDRRSTNDNTDALRDLLNHGIRRKQPNRPWPFRRVHFRDSSTCLPIQVVDVLLGAVAFHLNGHRLAAGASAAKCALSDHVLHRAGIADVHRDTAMTGPFTIWHRQLR